MQYILSENEGPDFKKEDVLKIARYLVEYDQPYIYHNSHGRDYATCDFCSGKMIDADWSDEKTLKMFNHETSCVYLIAKDMLVGYEA